MYCGYNDFYTCFQAMSLVSNARTWMERKKPIIQRKVESECILKTIKWTKEKKEKSGQG